MKAQLDGYEFSVYIKDGRWTFKPGVYIFAGRAPDRTWRACYIGETSSFAKRTPDHELWFTAVGLGASDVHVLIESHPARRTEIKQKLIAKHHPPLNK